MIVVMRNVGGIFGGYSLVLSSSFLSRINLGGCRETRVLAMHGNFAK